MSNPFGIRLQFEKGAPVDENEEKETTLVQGDETILVVEDENFVRELTVRTLLSNGYKVLQAVNGVDALRVAAEHEGNIHLLVSDAIMPEMGGKELADRLKEVRPSTQLLYVSGYTQEVTLAQGIVPEGTAFLQKPFSSRVLLGAVREILNTKSGSH